MEGATTFEQTNATLQQWLQGDVVLGGDLFFVHLADLAAPLSEEARQTAQDRIESGLATEIEGVASAVEGFAVLTQSCDIVRDCRQRPFLQVAPLVRVSSTVMNEIRLLRRPAFAYISGVADKALVADLDRAITVEKTLIRGWHRTSGCRDEHEQRLFADALARHRSRAAFPDSFNICIRPLANHLKRMHEKDTEEGSLLRSIAEIRAAAAPTWDAAVVNVFLWFVLDPTAAVVVGDRSAHVDHWLGLASQTEKFNLEGLVCRLEDMNAAEYVGSVRLDLDALSAA